MCGILGYFSAGKTFNPSTFADANNMVSYRGPDDFGYVTLDKDFRVHEWKDEYMRDMHTKTSILGALGFRRLSIIDLSDAGHQPMHEGNGEYWIVYNGEVYNYIEIRKELAARGYRFCSQTDTEVVLKSYVEWGSDCLRRLNGMWSFCILDIPHKKLFCARDRLGIKPFYYYFDRKNFVFASEVKQILPLLSFGSRMNEHVFFDYLAVGSYGNETRETFFESIYRIMPGEFLELGLADSEKFVLQKKLWWDLPLSGNTTHKHEEDIYESIRSLLEDSIRLRLRSDVPVGTCLSGGLDSSGIVCLVDGILRRTNQRHEHRVFVIGSIDPKIDETDYAKAVIKNTDVTPFFKFPDSLDLADELESFIWHHDEPLITASMFGGWHVYKLAKENRTTVVLDGQGSDELLGGYYYGAHIDMLSELVDSGKLVDFLHQLELNSTVHAVSEFAILKAIMAKYMRRVGRSVLPHTWRPSVYKKTKGWLNRGFVERNIPQSHVLNRDFYLTERRFSSAFKKKSYEFTRFTNLPGILRQVDRNAMAFSVEARVPFLDHRLVEFLFELPSHYILKNGYTKYAYRRAVEGIIPEAIRLRTDKQGFTMPDRELLAGAMPFVKSVVEKIPEGSHIYDKRSILNRVEASIAHECHYEPIVWRVINAIIWQTKFGMDE